MGVEGESQVRAVITARQSWQDPKPLEGPLAQGPPLPLLQLWEPELRSSKAASLPRSCARLERKGMGGGALLTETEVESEPRSRGHSPTLLHGSPLQTHLKEDFFPRCFLGSTYQKCQPGRWHQMTPPEAQQWAPITSVPRDHPLRGQPSLHVRSAPGEGKVRPSEVGTGLTGSAGFTSEQVFKASSSSPSLCCPGIQPHIPLVPGSACSSKTRREVAGDFSPYSSIVSSHTCFHASSARSLLSP